MTGNAKWLALVFVAIGAIASGCGGTETQEEAQRLPTKSSRQSLLQTWDPAAQYRIKSVNSNSNIVMSVQYDSTETGANIHQWTDFGKSSQRWFVWSTGDGYYMIRNVNSLKAADVEGPSTANGANIHQWDYVGGDNQKWSFVPIGSNPTYYLIVNKYSGKVMDVEFNSPYAANIHQWQYVDGVASQLWQIDRTN